MAIPGWTAERLDNETAKARAWLDQIDGGTGVKAFELSEIRMVEPASEFIIGCGDVGE
jgi:hypothetical protein